MKFIDSSKAQCPTLVIRPEAYEKILKIIFATDLEIAWHGLITREDYVFTLEDILIYPQEATTVTVESDDEKYPQWLMNVPNEQFNKIRLQGHSHVNMHTNPSGTDDRNRADILTQVYDYYIFMIINRKEDIHLMVYDVENNICYEDSDVDLVVPDSWAHEEISKNLSKKKKGIKRTTTKKAKKPIATSVNEGLTDEEITFINQQGYRGWGY